MAIPPDEPGGKPTVIPLNPPASLKPEAESPGASPTSLVSKFGSKDEATSFVNKKIEEDRQATAALDEYMSSNAARGIVIDEKAGRIVRLVKVADADLPPQGKLSDADYQRLLASLGKSTEGKWEEVPDPVGSALYRAKIEAERDLEWAKDDATNFSKSLPAVRSYLDTEEDKTKEIERQYDDFASRADEYQDLLAAEQDYVGGVTANNKAQLDLQQKYGIPPTVDTPLAFGQSLSSILRPSLPDYVRPDYRLNQAVGLPGPEGFDDPNYNSAGFPAFGSGTDVVMAYKSGQRRVPWALMPKPKWVWQPRGVPGAA